MPDPLTPADLLADDDAVPAADDAMPQGAARDRAQAELDAVEPGGIAQPHFAPQGDPEQQIDEPMHDMLGRRDGP